MAESPGPPDGSNKPGPLSTGDSNFDTAAERFGTVVRRTSLKADKLVDNLRRTLASNPPFRMKKR